MPAWLRDVTELNADIVGLFLSSRVVYYPGAGNDGQPFELFGGAHAACCFVHADYLVDVDEIRRQLIPIHPYHLHGYEPIAMQTFLPRGFPDESAVGSGETFRRRSRTRERFMGRSDANG
jgi:hypothetical protein